MMKYMIKNKKQFYLISLFARIFFNNLILSQEYSLWCLIHCKISWKCQSICMKYLAHLLVVQSCRNFTKTLLSKYRGVFSIKWSLIPIWDNSKSTLSKRYSRYGIWSDFAHFLVLDPKLALLVWFASPRWLPGLCQCQNSPSEWNFDRKYLITKHFPI